MTSPGEGNLPHRLKEENEMAHKVTFTLSDNELDYLKRMAKQEGDGSWKDYAASIWRMRLWEDREIYDVWHNNEG